MQEKTLDDYRKQLEKIEEMLKYAEIYGSIDVAGENISKKTLKDVRAEIKSKITQIISTTTLRRIK